MSRLLPVVLLIVTAVHVANAQECKLKINAFRAYQNNFAVFEISYEDSPEIVGIELSVDEPKFNVRSIQTVDKFSKTSRQGVNFQPHNLRVGDTIYYRLFVENDGKRTCETETGNFQIQELKVVKPT